MARQQRCARCETADELLERVPLALDGDSYTLRLCERCARNCRADVGIWTMFADIAPARALPLTRLPSSPFNALPPAGPPSPGRDVQVPFPVIRREEVEEQEPTSASVYNPLLNGYDITAVERAADTWRWARGARSKINERNLDTVAVLLAADCERPDEVIPGPVPAVEKRVLRGLSVIVATDTHTILDAYV